jgi:hypothetical protein
MSFVFPIPDVVEMILFDEHHENLCGCEGWPTACVNKLTTFTLSIEEILRVATPMIIAEWKRVNVW